MGRGERRDPVTSPARPASSACARYGSRPSSRTAADAGPLTAP
ncbi:hypothetical protein ACFQX7_35035 [Luedemannella flava]